MSRPSIEILPRSVSSSPAISRSSVDLPQPDGPTKTTNSPSAMSRSMLGMMVVAPNDLLTFLSTMLPMSLLRCRYLTAPKVRPRTSWRWLNQPMTRIGAMASVEAADSFAQNRPCGLENEAMKAVSGAALVVVRLRSRTPRSRPG